jgi:hypothetical protein
MLKKIGPFQMDLPIVVITWGIVMCAMAAVRTPAGLLAARFFLAIPKLIYFLAPSFIYHFGTQGKV